MPINNLLPGPDISNVIQGAMRAQEFQEGRETRQRQNKLLDWKLRPEALEREERSSKLNYEKDLLEYGRNSLQGIQPDEYPKYRETMIKFGMNPVFLPDTKAFSKPDESGKTQVFDPDKFEAWRTKTLVSADKLIKGPKEGDTIAFTVDDKDGPKEVTRQYLNGKWTELGRGAKFAPKDAKEKKAPTTRTIQRGETKVAQEWDPDTETWADVAEGPAWNVKPEREKEDKTLVEVQQPDGTTVWMKRSAAEGKPSPRRGGPSDTERRVAQKEIADVETKIRLNKDKQEVSGMVDHFNQNAEKPYAYVWKPGKVYGGEWIQQPLPKTAKGQVTAKDVADTAKARGISYEEALTKILELAEKRTVAPRRSEAETKFNMTKSKLVD